VARENEYTVEEVELAIHAHPTMSEAVAQAALDSLRSRGGHVTDVRRTPWPSASAPSPAGRDSAADHHTRATGGEAAAGPAGARRYARPRATRCSPDCSGGRRGRIFGWRRSRPLDNLWQNGVIGVPRRSRSAARGIPRRVADRLLGFPGLIAWGLPERRGRRGREPLGDRGAAGGNEGGAMGDGS